MSRAPSALCTILTLAMAGPVWAQDDAQAGGTRQPTAEVLDPTAVQQLAAEAGGADRVSINRATGTARFVRARRAVQLGLDQQQRGPEAATSAGRHGRVMAFLDRHARAFGLANPRTELGLLSTVPNRRGDEHLTYQQTYRNLPVFGATFKAHFDAADNLTAVNGAIVPEISVDPTPTRTADEAARVAVGVVAAGHEDAGVAVQHTRLLVFREGLLKGVPGPNRLAWEVEVGNRRDIREFLYVDAHTGKIIDQITGIHDDLVRRAYDGRSLARVPPEYPDSPFWVEGDPFPTSSTEADNMIIASKETYDFFLEAFGRDSFDGAGAVMDSIFNRGYSCPNASWNGVFISFCPGFTTDDITAHEWAHAYTQYTHNLIYQWQPGALNEAYSDIWGEVVDLLNERGTDEQSVRRATGCSEFQIFPPKVTVNSPEAIAGDYPAAAAAFGPPLRDTITGDLALVSDGAGASPTDACEPIVNTDTIAGNIALIDRGNCDFVVKVKNAQDAGASAAIVANNLDDSLIFMGGADPTITIASAFVGLTTGQQFKAHLGDVVNVTLLPEPPSPIIDSSVRWLMGEDLNGLPGTGGIRDMWTPTCMGQPAKVSDTEYFCQELDNGGVHFNSGIPNHAFALLVDGGVYNDQNVASIGLTKAAHLYYRAQTVYQVPTTNFADHADALDAACTDLIGEQLTDLKTGEPVPDTLSAADCEQVAKAMVAVEMQREPTQCNFQPLLAKDPPDRCGADTTKVNLFFDDFERDPSRRWSVSHAPVAPADFTERDWEWTSEIPDGREGSAFFAVDFQGGTCEPGGDESAVLHLQSPSIRIPSGVADPLVTFRHWIGSEEGWDGANVKVSVNGGPWQLVAPTDFTFNAYKTTLQPVAAGNTNPMAGQPAWTGADEGGFTGSWGRSHLRLASYAGPGDTVRLRFDFGTDGCTGTFGWYVDDVTVHACTSNALPTVDVGDASKVEGTRGLTPATFTLKLSHAYARPVIVRYRIADGTAQSPRDYLSIDKIFPFVVVPPLSIAARVPLALIGDHVSEPDETFSIRLKDAKNGVIGKASGVFTIIDDDGPNLSTNENSPGLSPSSSIR
ncbi:MAG: hypothetical protein GEV06_04540 [Luteitalea sp.]|nr:hypothetical protein [Luteitalea sp.]